MVTVQSLEETDLRMGSGKLLNMYDYRPAARRSIPGEQQGSG